jgi:ubiquinone/menaquinone biosynthesis C-methylase UbiE
MVIERNVKKFNQDVEINDGYYYTATERLSCKLANQRLSDAVTEMANLEGKRVIDVGCGDGTYTIKLLASQPDYLLGVDAAASAINCGLKKIESGSGEIDFCVKDIYKLDELKEKFDVAIVRGVLHHLDQVEEAIGSISKVAKEIIVIEPNGYNPVLKILEKTSRYHMEHDEKSYFPHQLDNWFNNVGGKVLRSSYCGLVPMFCPDWMAQIFKLIEPFVEKMPLLRQLGCAVYVQKIVFPGN